MKNLGWRNQQEALALAKFFDPKSKSGPIDIDCIKSGIRSTSAAMSYTPQGSIYRSKAPGMRIDNHQNTRFIVVTDLGAPVARGHLRQRLHDAENQGAHGSRQRTSLKSTLLANVPGRALLPSQIGEVPAQLLSP